MPNSYIQETQWFVEIAGGVAVSSSPYQYDTYSDYLHDELDFSLLPYLSLRVGARFQERHLLAGMWERIHLENGFRYRRNQFGFEGIGLGSTKETPYEIFGLYYEYNLLQSERFRLAPIVQMGIGRTDPTPSFVGQYLPSATV